MKHITITVILLFLTSLLLGKIPLKSETNEPNDCFGQFNWADWNKFLVTKFCSDKTDGRDCIYSNGGKTVALKGPTIKNILGKPCWLKLEYNDDNKLIRVMTSMPLAPYDDENTMSALVASKFDDYEIISASKNNYRFKNKYGDVVFIECRAGSLEILYRRHKQGDETW